MSSNIVNNTAVPAAEVPFPSPATGVTVTHSDIDIVIPDVDSIQGTQSKNYDVAYPDFLLDKNLLDPTTTISSSFPGTFEGPLPGDLPFPNLPFNVENFDQSIYPDGAMWDDMIGVSTWLRDNAKGVPFIKGSSTLNLSPDNTYGMMAFSIVRSLHRMSLFIGRKHSPILYHNDQTTPEYKTAIWQIYLALRNLNRVTYFVS